MGYIGNQTTNAYTSMDKQDITGNGGANYTLSHAVANEQEIEVFVNNVRQEGGVGKAYTVSGTALTMTGNVSSSDEFYVVFQGKAVGTIVPPDASVSTAKIIDGSVTSAKLASTIAPTNLETTASNFKMTDLTTNAFYRTGTFTPFWTSGNVTTAYESNLFTAASYQVQRGDYVRIGNIVHATIFLKLDHSAAGYANSGSHSQALGVNGLPFKVKNVAQYYPMTSSVYYEVDTDQGWASYNLVGYGTPDKKYVLIFFPSAGGTTTSFKSGHIYGLPQGQGVPASSNATDTEMLFQLTYETDEA